MKTISKGREPPSLTTFREGGLGSYEDYPDKARLRQALIAEQGSLCCYCMGPIHNGPTGMKIEHWRSRRRYRTEQLVYRNLLAACRGGTGQPPSKQHCDTHKGDRDLSFNPAEPTHRVETRIRYKADGRIWSREGAFNRELNDVLNLNLRLLMNRRKRVLDGILEWWRHEKARRRGPVPRSRFQWQRNRITQVGRDRDPYSQVAVWWIDQRLSTTTP